MDGISEIKKLYSQDSRNLEYLQWLATYETNANNYKSAINFRELITQYDPWNAENFLQLGLLYKSEGKLEKSQEMLAIIMSFAGKNEIARIAQEKLT
jgi:tetratricopeptide (TPR) repeat protein